LLYDEDARGESVASMKAPPKRKGNPSLQNPKSGRSASLNESPSEKEGKLHLDQGIVILDSPSMKALPKRKGNFL